MCYLHAVVLPSKTKDRIYNVQNCCKVPSRPDVPTDVLAVYCVCPTGLAGSCNRVASFLYAMVDFVSKGLRGKLQKLVLKG